MAEKSGAANGGWTVSKVIPVPYIAAILFQTAVMLVVGTSWVTATNERLKVLEDFKQQSIMFTARLAVLESTTQASAAQMTALTATINGMLQRNGSNTQR